MPHTVVIGYGNPLRGDDRVGFLAAELLRDELAGRDVEVIACHQLTPELSEVLSRADQAIFLDACAGPAPGTISRRPLAADPDLTTSFTHNLDPGTLLATAQVLFGAVPRTAWILTVAGADFDYTEELSAPVAATLPLLLEELRALTGNAGRSADPR